MSETKAVIKTHQMLTRSSASRYLAQDTIIPAGYLMISSGAFSGQNKIYTLKFPRDLVSIKSKAFYSCQYLKEVRLPHSVQELGRDAFSECYRLRKVYISNKLETIPDHCFSRDGKLNRVLFTPSSTLTSIGTEAFYECGSLPYILLPPHVTSIGDRAFYRCKSLATVRFPKTLRYIGKKAFYFCAMDKLELPDTLEVLDESAFFKCVNLTEVVLPPSVRYIGKWVFHGCSRLKVLEIRHDPDYIGPWIINRAARIRCYKGSKVDAYCLESGFTTEYIETSTPPRKNRIKRPVQPHFMRPAGLFLSILSYECILLITFSLVNSSRSFSSRALEMSFVSAS